MVSGSGGPVANTEGLATKQRVAHRIQQFVGPHIYTLTPVHTATDATRDHVTRVNSRINSVQCPTQNKTGISEVMPQQLCTKSITSTIVL